MRKIESNLIAAIRSRRRFASGNTTYNPTNGHVRLHGNLIAVVLPPDGDRSRWTLAGWNTNTTRSRINALANAFWLPGVRNIHGTPHAGTTQWEPITSTQWVG
jgi:hypothetical protein